MQLCYIVSMIEKATGDGMKKDRKFSKQQQGNEPEPSLHAMIEDDWSDHDQDMADTESIGEDWEL